MDYEFKNQPAYKGQGWNYWASENDKDSYTEFQKYQWKISCSVNQF